MAEIEVSERYVPSLAVQSMPNPLPGSRVITPLFNGTQQEGGVYRLKYVQKSWIPLGNIFNNVKSANGWRPSIWHEFDIARSKVFLGDGTVMNSKAFVRPNNERIVPNSQRNEVYVFDSALRHVKTLNLTTGKLKFRFEYTSLDKISKIIDNYNNETLFNYSGSNLTSIVSPYGHVTNFSVDVSGYLSSASLSNNENYTMIYNAEGLLTSFTKPSGNLSVMTYDSDGNLISDVNDSGYSSTLSSSFLSGVRTISQISAEGRVRTVNFDNSDFNTKTLTEPSGLTMSTVWDNSQLESTTYGPNSYTEHHKKTIFERFGEGFYRLSEVIRNGSQLPSKSTLESAELIDPLDPLSVSNLTTTVTEGDSITISHYNSSTKTMTATSSLGLETTIIHNNQGDPISVKLGPYLPFTLTYDSHGRITSSGQGSSRQTHYTYGSNGLIATSTDPLNRTTSYNYNSEDRISTVLLPDLRSIQFSYDDGGNVISVMPANNKIHHFTYDSSELMSSYLPPALSANSATFLHYNNDRQIAQITKPSLESIDFSYGLVSGLLETISFSGVQRSFFHTNGYLTSAVSEDAVSNQFGYFGEVPNYLSSSTSLLPNFYNLYNSFHSSMQVSNESLSSLNGNPIDISFNYNSDNLLTGAGTQVLTRSNLTGLISLIQLGNLKENYQYSSDFGELSSLEAKYNSVIHYKETLTRNQLARVTAKLEQYGVGPADLYTYSYDPSGRLIQVSKNGLVLRDFAYDLNNNRISVTESGGTLISTYDDQDRLLLSGTKSFTYSPNGNVTSMSVGGVTTSLVYDLLGNLKSYSQPSKIITYTVDSLDRRTSKKVGSAMKNYFMWNLKNQLIGITNGSGVMQSRFVYGSKAHVPDYMIKGTTRYKIITDHLGSPVRVVNATNGSILQEVKYDEWGNILSDTSPGYTPFGFAGCLYDIDTKLCRFGARDYDASIGRWLSKDPILFAGGDTNLYGYVMQDPINFIDPSGLFLIAPPPFVIVPIDLLPKPINPNPHDSTLLEKSAYLLHLDRKLQTDKDKNKNFDDYWDNVILKKKNNYDHINCSGI